MGMISIATDSRRNSLTYCETDNGFKQIHDYLILVWLIFTMLGNFVKLSVIILNLHLMNASNTLLKQCIMGTITT